MQKKPEKMPRRQCNGKSRTTGEQCKRHCPEGYTVCYWHGASRMATTEAAERRREEWYARKAAVAQLKDTGYQKIEDPYEALSYLAGEVWAAKEFFRSKIDQLRYQSATGEQLRSEVALYERALDRCAKLLEAMARLGISERRQQLAEAQALMIATAVQRVLDRLNLTYRQQMLAATIVPEELRAISVTGANEYEEWPEDDALALNAP